MHGIRDVEVAGKIRTESYDVCSFEEIKTIKDKIRVKKRGGERKLGKKRHNPDSSNKC